MKRVNSIVSCCIILSIVLLFTGCRKIIEHFRHHDDPDQVSCRITKITVPVFNEPDSFRILDFDYDEAGNPIAIHVNGKYSANYQLRYNAAHQLTDLIELNQDSQYITWHRYRYNGTLIVQDTVHQAGGGPLSDIRLNAFSAGWDSLLGVVVLDITYDDQQRPIRDTGTYIQYPSEDHYYYKWESVFLYDASGNRITNPLNPAIYDDKTSIYRTNKVWQFIYKDYSVNNPVGSVSYNAAGLPTMFSPHSAERTGIPNIGGVPLEGATIEYDCESD